MTEHLLRSRTVVRSAALVTCCALAACGGNGEAHTATDTTKSKSSASAVASTSLTPDQLEHLNIAPVSVVSFRPLVQTTGTVAFDGELSTQVLAPISGPVLRILVQPGVWVT
jgi:cobalt-zinc-cadmium efflux system membrane fusion protein